MPNTSSEARRRGWTEITVKYRADSHPEGVRVDLVVVGEDCLRVWGYGDTFDTAYEAAAARVRRILDDPY